MDTRQLIARSIEGAQWTLFLAVASVPFTYATNVLLGRVAPQALGLFGLLAVTVNVIVTFFLLGGNNVVVNFLPQLSRESKFPFLLTYLVVVLGFAVLSFGVVLVWPSPLRLLYNRELDAAIYGYLALLLPVVLVQTLAIAALQAEMDIAGAAIGQNIPYVASFALIAGLYSLAFGSFRTRQTALIAVTVLLAYGLSCLFSLVRLYYGPLRNWPLEWQRYLPADFWRFSLPFHLGTLFLFAYEGGDQIVALHYLGLSGLGYYRAALVTAQFVRWVPNVLSRAIYPAFCNLVARREWDLLAKAYAKSMVVATAASSLIGLTLGVFAPQVLSLFGGQFDRAAAPALLLLVGTSVLAAPLNAVNGAMLVAQGRTDYGAGLNGALAAYGLALYIALAARYGILGIALANGIALLIHVLVSAIVIARLFSLKMDAHVLIPAIVSLAVIALAYQLPNSEWTTRALVEIVGVCTIIVFLVRSRLLSWQDVLALQRSISMGLR